MKFVGVSAWEATPWLYDRDWFKRDLVHFLFRCELLIHTILTRQWDDDAWPLVSVREGDGAPQPIT